MVWKTAICPGRTPCSPVDYVWRIFLPGVDSCGWGHRVRGLSTKTGCVVHRSEWDDTGKEIFIHKVSTIGDTEHM